MSSFKLYVIEILDTKYVRLNRLWIVAWHRKMQESIDIETALPLSKILLEIIKIQGAAYNRIVIKLWLRSDYIAIVGEIATRDP